MRKTQNERKMVMDTEYMAIHMMGTLKMQVR